MEFKILNETVEADLFDPDVMAAFEDTIQETVRKVQETIKDERPSEGIRRQCQAVIDCIDTIFGEGAAAKVFDGKTNLLKCLDAFEDVCFIHEQMSKKIQQKAAAIQKRVAKYDVSRIDRK